MCFDPCVCSIQTFKRFSICTLFRLLTSSCYKFSSQNQNKHKTQQSQTDIQTILIIFLAKAGHKKLVYFAWSSSNTSAYAIMTGEKRVRTWVIYSIFFPRMPFRFPFLSSYSTNFVGVSYMAVQQTNVFNWSINGAELVAEGMRA